VGNGDLDEHTASMFSIEGILAGTVTGNVYLCISSLHVFDIFSNNLTHLSHEKIVTAGLESGDLGCLYPHVSGRSQNICCAATIEEFRLSAVTLPSLE